MSSELQAEIEALKIELEKMPSKIDEQRARAVSAETMVVDAKQEVMQNWLHKIIQKLHASTQNAQELISSLEHSSQLELYLFECENAEEQGRQTLRDQDRVFEALKQQLKEGMLLDSLAFPTEPQMPAPLQPPQEFIGKPDEFPQSQQTDPAIDVTNKLKPVVIEREPLKKAVKLQLLVAREIPRIIHTEFKSATDEVRAEAGPQGLSTYNVWGLEFISQMIVEKIKIARNNKRGRVSHLSKVATEWVDKVPEGSEETCCICMQRLTTHMHRCRGCRALYHQKCLKDWLDTISVHNATCPNCRRGIKMITDLLEF